MADSNSDGREPQKPFSITGYIRTAEGDQKALATARNALEHLQAKRKRLADEKKVAKDQALDEDEDDDDDEKEEVGEEEGDDVGEEEDDSSDDGTPGRVNEHLRGESPNSAELRAIEGEEFMKARDWVMRGGLRLADKARDTGEVDDEQHESKTEEKMEGDSDDAEGSGEEEQGGEGEGKKKDKEVT